MQTELECLRGSFNEDDLPLESPCLIHIWIPSVFLTGQPSDIHHVYQVIIMKKKKKHSTLHKKERKNVLLQFFIKFIILQILDIYTYTGY